jgi:N-acetylglucosaminyldiphosphoundecaprenol N-acetyl-beta-D-mannosaminyltransferase
MLSTSLGSIEFRTGNPQQLLAILLNNDSQVMPTIRCLGYLNPHVYNCAAADSAVGSFLKKCDFVCLDGVGVVCAANLLNFQCFDRMVMDQVFDSALAEGHLRGSAILLGLTAEEISAAAKRIAGASQGFRIVEVHHGFLTEAEYERILRDHVAVDFVIVGMGSPKSERVLLRASEICTHAICWHVGGGTLRNWAGTKRRAPRIVSRIGLEWLHRMIFEPETRGRYAMGIPEFAYRLAKDTWCKFRTRIP